MEQVLEQTATQDAFQCSYPKCAYWKCRCFWVGSDSIFARVMRGELDPPKPSESLDNSDE